MAFVRPIALALTAHLALVSAGHAQPTGGPPSDVDIQASATPEGIVLSPATIELTRGEYYRLNLACRPDQDGDPSLAFDLADFVRDLHLRVLTVDTIEVYLQGLSFRALQCEGEGKVSFSFYPMRAGDYEVQVTDQTEALEPAALSISVE
ncbi:hypothetical protein DYI37_10930 [Fulvimarina endophytica]|uniref:Uncharacterized protein n=1 Tax=Fulvimarina endophytica TaxID=2293836 RepID=A0A371X2R1_9HYPH|nr:hypothetical protein [Fulvimarina endophytica]RFC63525.1 hypothetical protein DYI37_10930 [Fulvimarina endophytica]